MKDSLKQLLSLVALFGVLLSLAACQSTPKQASSSTNDATLAQIAAKQQQQDQLLKEWQNLKPGLERLLVVEEELNLLLGQLEQLNASLEASEQPVAAVEAPARKPVETQVIPAPQVASAPPVQAIAPLAMPVAEEEPEAEPVSIPAPAPVHTASSQAGRFALQVASITERHRLPEIWQQLQSKHPRLTSDMEPNFQQTQVRNTDYFRLKLGRFASRQEANSRCNAMQSAGMNCLVVDYTASNFEQLVN